jgi:hypothetical protein
MKFAVGIAAVLVLASGFALAAPNETTSKDASATASKQTSTRKDCSTIKSTTVRQACLDREAAEHPGRPQSANMSDAVDDLQRENDRLSKKLQGICRGC